jgi:hypothetical protein
MLFQTFLITISGNDLDCNSNDKKTKDRKVHGIDDIGDISKLL